MTKRKFENIIPTCIPGEITVSNSYHLWESNFLLDRFDPSPNLTNETGSCKASSCSVVTDESFKRVLPFNTALSPSCVGLQPNKSAFYTKIMLPSSESSQHKILPSMSCNSSKIHRNICHYVRVCQICGIAGTFAHCFACKEVHYCSRDHQKTDWPQHKFICNYIAAKPTSVFVQVSPGEGNGLNNDMKSHIFDNKREGLEYIAMMFFGGKDLSRPLRSPFCELLGWQVEIFCNSNHQQFFLRPHGSCGEVIHLLGNRVDGVNGAGVFLGCSIDTGISRYKNLDGTVFVFGRHIKTGRPLTQYILWEILDFIYDCMDAYDEEEDSNTGMVRDALTIIEQDASRYRKKQMQHLLADTQQADVTVHGLSAHSVDHRRNILTEKNSEQTLCPQTSAITSTIQESDAHGTLAQNVQQLEDLDVGCNLRQTQTFQRDKANKPTQKEEV